MPGISAPTSRADWRLMARTVRLVLSLPAYALLALVAAVAALSTFVLSQNPQFIGNVVVFGSAGPVSRLQALLGLYPGFGSAYALPTAAVLVLVSTLVGVNISMAIYHFREHELGPAKARGASPASHWVSSARAVRPVGRRSSRVF
jgi:hypothetical protein